MRIDFQFTKKYNIFIIFLFLNLKIIGQTRVKDSLQKETNLKFNTIIQADYIHYSELLPNQNTPNHVLRTNINSTIEILGYKLNFNSNITSEDINNQRNLNNFGFNLDLNSLKNIIKQKSKQLEFNKNLDSLLELNKSYDYEINKINLKLNEPSYKDKYNKDKLVQERGRNDTLFYKKRYFKSRNLEIDNSKYENEKHRLDSLFSLKTELDKKIKILKLAANYNIDLTQKDVTNNPSILSSTRINKQHKFKSYRLLESIKKLDIVDYNLSMSKVSLNGINLRGFQIEINPRNIYFGISAGFINSKQEINFNTRIKEYLSATRVGFGDLNNSYIGLIYAKGRSLIFNKDGLQDNQILGFQFGLKVAENHIIQGEGLWSNYSLNDDKKELNDLLSSITKSRLNAAFDIKYLGYFKKTKTNFSLSAKETGLFFYSIGNPFLRNDIQAFELGAQQTVFKNKIVIKYLGKLEHDNISQTKSSSTSILMHSIGLNLKLKKSVLGFTYKSILSENTIFKKFNETRSFSFMYNTRFKFLSKSNNFNALLGYLTAEMLDTIKVLNTVYSNLMHNISINDKVMVSQLLNINNNFLSSDSSFQLLYNNSIDYLFEKYAFGLSSGYSNQNSIEERLILKPSIKINFSDKDTIPKSV